MIVTANYIRDAIKNDNIEQISEVMEVFKLSKNSETSIMTVAGRNIAKSVLSFAAAEDYYGSIKPRMVYEIFEYVGAKIELFDFAKLVASAAKIENTDFEALPEKLRVSLEKDNISDEIINIIRSLDRSQLEALLDFIASGKTRYLSLKFNLIIIGRAYDAMLIPTHLFLSFLAICLCDPY